MGGGAGAFRIWRAALECGTWASPSRRGIKDAIEERPRNSHRQAASSQPSTVGWDQGGGWLCKPQSLQIGAVVEVVDEVDKRPGGMQR